MHLSFTISLSVCYASVSHSPFTSLREGISASRRKESKLSFGWTTAVVEGACVHLSFTVSLKSAICFSLAFSFSLLRSQLPLGGSYWLERVLCFSYALPFTSLREGISASRRKESKLSFGWTTVVVEGACVHISFTVSFKSAICVSLAFSFSLLRSQLPLGGSYWLERVLYFSYALPLSLLRSQLPPQGAFCIADCLAVYAKFSAYLSVLCCALVSHSPFTSLREGGGPRQWWKEPACT